MAPTVSIEFAGHRESKKFSQKVFPQMMGKTREVSKGYSCGFVPDYCHAVENMAEPEGLVSSGRIDARMTASEDPCAPKRKCVSLNGDAYKQFGVPIQVLSLSKLSSFQRKDLLLTLKHELEQVRTFQRKIAMIRSGDVTLFPSSDIQSCSAGQRRPVPEISRSTAEPVSHSKKHVPPGRSGGGRMKKPASTRLDPVNKALPPTSGNGMLMKQCETLLNRLLGHTYGWVFKTPVDAVALKIPDYYTVIKHPMDLGTVRTKLTSGRYADPWGFAADVRLTFSNALTYNRRGHDVYVMAETMSKFFEARWKPMEKKLLVATKAVVPPKPTMLMETKTSVPMPPLKKKTASVESEINQVPAKKVMSDVEKHKLGSELESLLAEFPESIIDFLKENSSNRNQTTEDEIEIDIGTLSDDTLLILRKLLDDYLADKQKNMVKAETCEIELHNWLGFSNSSMQPCKANDLNEEDIDIVGNDLPISSFSPVEIEKDSAVRNSKCSNSSSSSSEDGSSSSESDSGTSSGSDADGAKASAILNNVKATMGSEKTTVASDAEPENRSVNGVSQVEQESQSNPVSGEVDDRQEGESARSKRQVSPVKHYRAALLKSRFADTILKAQEKTIRKGGKQGPEWSRLQKEEIEKRRKEEKARLQEEAKAAEEAQRNAEAEAAAEAKRKRELEREAARQALQKMEKTVDIDENLQFLDDLEMLQAAPTKPLQSLIDEAPSVHSRDPLGSFKFQGNGNPLEQLGLYMKEDYEEEEEVEPQVAQAMFNDPEEGEID